LLIVLTILATSLSAPVYSFCGFYAGKADVTLLNKASRVVVARDGNRTVLSMLNDYHGDLREFALIVPTPVVLQRGQVRVADRAVFEHLDAYSSPRLAEYTDSDPCRTDFGWGQDIYPRTFDVPLPISVMAPAPTLRDRALGVTVDARYTLEEYDIVSLSAKRSDGLEVWLRENDYRIPAGAGAALKPYINQGMKFFVAKVNLKEQAKTGYTMLRPLQFAFESEKFMLPMRLGMLNAPPDEAQDLIVYVLTRRGRVESSNYRTIHLPANVNLPAFVKPKFQDFYKAMFDTVSKREDYRVVFTEYFWDMASYCDPCAAEPLSHEEMQKSGVFWLDGDAAEGFKWSQNPTRRGPPRAPSDGDEAQSVLLTRLHLRYTARTFPEDVMFTETNDQQSWQARYVIQNPYGGSLAQCSEKVGRMDCAAMCSERVSSVRSALGLNETNEPLPNSARRDKTPTVTVLGSRLNGPDLREYRGKDINTLQSECVARCQASKLQGLQAATLYYQRTLPERIATEKQTLAQLTGWSLHEIDAMPGAELFSTPSPDGRLSSSDAGPRTEQPWWHSLFSH
jgi:hypothetical protein